MRAVNPSLFIASIFAFLFKSAFTISMRPFWEANNKKEINEQNLIIISN